jgi:hypothetical protein
MYFDAKGKLRSMLASWTSLAEQDLFAQTAAECGTDHWTLPSLGGENELDAFAAGDGLAQTTSDTQAALYYFFYGQWHLVHSEYGRDSPMRRLADMTDFRTIDATRTVKQRKSPVCLQGASAFRTRLCTVSHARRSESNHDKLRTCVGLE